MALNYSSRTPNASSACPGGWTFFSFGHHKPPYAKQANAFPAEICNACHEASAETDYVFSQFHPVLRAVQK
jgi:hypothetical protein